MADFTALLTSLIRCLWADTSTCHCSHSGLLLRWVKNVIPPKVAHFSHAGCFFFICNRLSGCLYQNCEPFFCGQRVQPGIEQKEFCCTTPPIANTGNTTDIVSPQDNLCAIRVMFARNVKLTKGVIRFVLRHAGDDQEAIARITLPVKTIDDFSKNFLFVFPPVANSQGKQFAFILDTPDLSNQEYPALIYEKESAFENGFLHFNNQQHPKYFFLRHFIFPPTHNQIPGWEGRHRLKTKAGMSPYENFSCMVNSLKIVWGGKQTSKKIHRVEKMLLNRAQP